MLPEEREGKSEDLSDYSIAFDEMEKVAPSTCIHGAEMKRSTYTPRGEFYFSFIILRSMTPFHLFARRGCRSFYYHPQMIWESHQDAT